MLQQKDLIIPALGPCLIDSPLSQAGQAAANFDQPHLDDLHAMTCVDDSARILLENRRDRLVEAGCDIRDMPAFEMAGPRKKIYFDPSKLHAGIVTCGGLCPGLNDVIRSLVMELHYRYGVRKISGFRYGYQGFIPSYGHEPLELTPELVEPIHETGGTILGTSRGRQDYGRIVDCLQQMGVNILFVIGGDGTQRGAMHIADVAAERGLKISFVGIPKTIDNDILYIDKSFGFETAFSVATHAVLCAHTEAVSAVNGVGLVKLMGRDSGSIACHTTLATSHPNIVLIPEIPFKLAGDGGLLNYLTERLKRRRHACIVVAEGAGQDLMKDQNLGTDASGNARFKDIGEFLQQKFTEHLSGLGMDHTVKYIDPSYIIRSVPATPKDSLYCLRLAQGAVHAAMSGRTEMVIGRWRESFVHVPMKIITSGKKYVDPDGDLWHSVLEATGQPPQFA